MSLDRFKVIVNGVEDYRAYAVCEPALLNEIIPEGIQWSSVVVTPAEYDEEGNETAPAVTRQKSLKEFVGLDAGKAHWFLEDGQVMFKLSAIEYAVGRKNALTEQDIQDWLTYLSLYGVIESDLYTEEEAKAMMPKEEL